MVTLSKRTLRELRFVYVMQSVWQSVGGHARNLASPDETML